MNEQFLEPKDTRRELLILLRKGMPVKDRLGEPLGLVEKVFLGQKSVEGDVRVSKNELIDLKKRGIEDDA